MSDKFLDWWTVFSIVLCLFVGTVNAFQGDVFWATLLLGLALINFLLLLFRLAQRRKIKELEEKRKEFEETLAKYTGTI